MKIAVWRHWPNIDLQPQSLASAVIEYHQRFDSHFVKVSTSSNSLCAAFGVERDWQNSETGSYQKNTHVFNIKELVENNANLSLAECKQLTANLVAHKLINNRIQCQDTSCFATVYSPLYHLNSLLGGQLDYQQLLRPENQAMLDLLTSLTVEYIRALQQIKQVSIYYCSFYSSEHFCSHADFTRNVAKYDMNCISAMEGQRNLLHYHCQLPVYYDFLTSGKFAFISIEQCFDLVQIAHLLNDFKAISFVGLLDPILAFSGDLEIRINEFVAKLSDTLDIERLIIAPSCTLPLSISDEKMAEILRIIRRL